MRDFACPFSRVGKGCGEGEVWAGRGDRVGSGGVGEERIGPGSVRAKGKQWGGG